MTPTTATRAWFDTIEDVILNGEAVAPRGQATTEVLQHTLAVDMLHPVVVAPTRILSEKFLGAEAHWILSGDDRVETIAPFNKNIAQFSDDGERFFGAYGPKIASQLDYVVAKLLQDKDTRQAGLTLWRENPPETKDVPCTIAMFFNLRGASLDTLKMNMHVFMRSSDVWLGVPYDVFNFSMVAMQVMCRLNRALLDIARHSEESVIKPGALYLTAASRHLYGRDVNRAVEVMHSDPWRPVTTPVPRVMYTDEAALMRTLDAIRQGDKEARWWRQPS